MLHYVATFSLSQVRLSFLFHGVMREDTMMVLRKVFFLVVAHGVFHLLHASAWLLSQWSNIQCSYAVA